MHTFISLLLLITSLLWPEGDDDEEESGEERLPSCFDYIMHFLTVFWKVLFAFVPPTEYWNGWACFIVSISLIGVLTAVTGDLASHFGCTIGLKDSVTAVVFVALGTSVPGECRRFDSTCQVERREIKCEIRCTSREDRQISPGALREQRLQTEPVSTWRDVLSRGFNSLPPHSSPQTVYCRLLCFSSRQNLWWPAEKSLGGASVPPAAMLCCVFEFRGFRGRLQIHVCSLLTSISRVFFLLFSSFLSHIPPSLSAPLALHLGPFITLTWSYLGSLSLPSSYWPLCFH